jgi:hypothetical protein
LSFGWKSYETKVYDSFSHQILDTSRAKYFARLMNGASTASSNENPPLATFDGADDDGNDGMAIGRLLQAIEASRIECK